MNPRALLCARTLVCTAGVLLWAVGSTSGAPGGSCAVAGKSACVIDLHGPKAPRISPECSAEPWSKYLRFTPPEKYLDSNADGWWETAVEIALDPARECGCAKLRIHFEDPALRWSLNVGDSPTNDGHGGDAGTTFNEAQQQIQDGVLTVL